MDLFDIEDLYTQFKNKKNEVKINKDGFQACGRLDDSTEIRGTAMNATSTITVISQKKAEELARESELMILRGIM